MRFLDIILIFVFRFTLNLVFGETKSAYYRVSFRRQALIHSWPIFVRIFINAL